MTEELQAFLLERAQHYFREVRGFKYDEVNAVLAGGWRSVSNLLRKLIALSRVRKSKDFEPLAASFRRIKNILKQADFEPQGRISQALLEPGPELELFEAYESAKKVADSAGSDFEEALSAIASIRPQVDAFFEKVLVNVADSEIRTNRLTLLYFLLGEFSTIADFSEIVTLGDTK